MGSDESAQQGAQERRVVRLLAANQDERQHIVDGGHHLDRLGREMRHEAEREAPCLPTEEHCWIDDIPFDDVAPQQATGDGRQATEEPVPLSPAPCPLSPEDEVAGLRRQLAETEAARQTFEQLAVDLKDAAEDVAECLKSVMAERDSAQEDARACHAVIPQLRTELILLKKEHATIVAAHEDALEELDEARRELSWLEREHAKCDGLRQMLEGRISRLDAQLQECQEGGLPSCVEGRESGEMVPVDGGALQALGRQAAQTEQMRQRFHYLNAAETDARLKPGQKATVAALVDLCGAPPGGGTFTEPKKVCRAAVAQRTGQALGTVSKVVPDLAGIGVVKLERREVLRTREGGDPEARPIQRPEEEWWISLGPLPPKDQSKEEIQARCARAQAERERKKRCPSCGSASLEALSYRCKGCGHTCASAQACAAGERFEERAGAIVDLQTGEKLVSVPAAIAHSGRSRPSDPSWNPGGGAPGNRPPQCPPLGIQEGVALRTGMPGGMRCPYPSWNPVGVRGPAPCTAPPPAHPPPGIQGGVWARVRVPQCPPIGIQRGGEASERMGPVHRAGEEGSRMLRQSETAPVRLARHHTARPIRMRIVALARAYRAAVEAFDQAFAEADVGVALLAACEDAGEAVDRARNALFSALDELDMLEEGGG